MIGLSHSKIKGFYRKIQPWLIWSLGAAFFFLEYFARVDPSVIVPQLMTFFHVGAFALGSLSAFFLFSFSLICVWKWRDFWIEIRDSHIVPEVQE